jgi:hypothetical protein
LPKVKARSSLMQSGCFQTALGLSRSSAPKGATAVDDQARQGRLHGRNTACALLAWALILLLRASPGMMDQRHACPCMVCSSLDTAAKVQAVGSWHPEWLCRGRQSCIMHPQRLGRRIPSPDISISRNLRRGLWGARAPPPPRAGQERLHRARRRGMLRPKCGGVCARRYSQLSIPHRFDEPKPWTACIDHRPLRMRT